MESAVSLREMLKRDRASEALGMMVVTDDPGRAVVTMTVREDMLNGFAITHGGLVFALADTAFAMACNDSEHVTVAAGAEITFLKATALGDVLTATATARAIAGRTGVYDVEVVDADNEIVAVFRGHSRRTSTPFPH